VDFSSRAVLVCDSEYQVVAVSYSEGELVLTVDYTRAMEDAECELTVTYDSDTTTLQNNTLQFTAKGRNMALSFVEQSSLATKGKITFIFRLLSYLALAAFCLSLLHKTAGLEFIVACQLVYFSFAFYPRPTFVASSLKAFQMVTGYQTMFYRPEYGELMYPFTYATEMSRQFLENNFFWTALMAVILLVGVLLVAYMASKQKVKNERPH
jgi:hypothetical protein